MDKHRTTNPRRAVSDRKAPARNGYRYRPQYGLIVPCKDEADQQRVFERLTRQGYQPKVVCV